MRPYQPHEWSTIVDIIKTEAPWRPFPEVLTDGEFIAAWLTQFSVLESQGNLSKETLVAWWHSTEEYTSTFPTWNAKPEPPLPGTPSAGVDRLALPVVVTPRGWGDQTGIRPLLFASWFPLIRILKDNPDRFERTLDMLQSWGVVGIRGFIDVRHPGYWQGREVKHEWPDYVALVQATAEALRSRGMAWFITAGDLQLTNGREAYRLAAEALQSYRDVVAVVDVNEAWQNTEAGRDDPEHCKRLLDPFIRMGVPWATSAHSGEDNAEHLNLMWKSVGAPVCTVHGPGGTDLMVRHIINHRHAAEGVGFNVALMQGEPRGPGQDVSAGRVDHPSWVVLAATAACMTGQMYVLHCSRGVRDRDDDDPWYAFAPYFQRTAAVLKWIPRSKVMVSAHGGGGGNRPEAVFASTRPDGAFYGDRNDVRGQFHRCDAAFYENGERACLCYGGVGDRELKSVRNISGTFYNTHGDAVRAVTLSQGEIVRFSDGEAGDGLLFVGR